MLILCLLFHSYEAPSVVKVVKEGENYHLTRNGEYYFVKGAGGESEHNPISSLVSIGGNSVRTWGIDNAQKILDEAEKAGATVCLGIWLAYEVNYNDQADLNKQKDEVRKMVQTYKNHPALLMYALGNEGELHVDNNFDIYFRQINELAKICHEEDPNHPATTVLADIWDDKMTSMRKLLTDIDVVGINSYGGCKSLAGRVRAYNPPWPYMLTEFGTVGTEDSEWTPWAPYGFPIERTSTEKADQYEEHYKVAVLAEKDKLCLGSYVFLWGFKHEITNTWFGMFLPGSEERFNSVEVMAKYWNDGVLPANYNRCPTTEPLVVSQTREVHAQQLIKAGIQAKDPENDQLTYEWVLYLYPYGMWPDRFDNAFTKGQGTNQVEILIPSVNTFLLYCYVKDGKGNCAFANAGIQASLPAE